MMPRETTNRNSDYSEEQQRQSHAVGGRQPETAALAKEYVGGMGC